MNFFSILSPGEDPGLETAASPPDCFCDLNLDQVIDAVSKPALEQHVDIRPFFWSPPRDVEVIRYRQEVMRDLEHPETMAHVKAFLEKMRLVQRYREMAEKLYSVEHRQGWLLEAALIYGEAVASLSEELTHSPLRSRGLLAFREYLQGSIQSAGFQSFLREAEEVKQELAAIRYVVILRYGKFRVKRCEGEADCAPEVQRTFAKFRQGDAPMEGPRLPQRSGLSHIEAKILEFVHRLFPEPFAKLERFVSAHGSFVETRIETFAREILFYIAYLDFIAALKQKGLPFCYPEVFATCKAIAVHDGFDLALARARHGTEQPQVLNGVFLQEPERILVVTGPNQGGKTTFARMFGQVHYLAGLGCPVPESKACLFLFDRILTHFERGEDLGNLRGKLEDDLLRIHDLLARGTPRSLFILNEIFTSTTFQDALFLSQKILNRLMELDAVTVRVTFLDELASRSEKTVSLVATVDPAEPTRRTFKLVRKPADGLAYALSLARKHRLACEQLMERLP